MIPAIQSFFEVFNYYFGLIGSVFGYIWQFFSIITSSLGFFYSLFSMLPGWLVFFAVCTLAYLVIMFVFHPE